MPRYLTQHELDGWGERFQFLRRIRPPYGVEFSFALFLLDPARHERLLLARLRDWAENPRLLPPAAPRLVSLN